MKKAPKRDRDVRIQITKRVFGEYSRFYWINKGTIMDGSLDKDGNFLHNKREYTIIYPSHFKILGKFYFRKTKAV